MTTAALTRPVKTTAYALLALHAAHPERYPVLFESAAADASLGQFDILFACPGDTLTLRSDGMLLEETGKLRNDTFLQALNDWFRKECTESTSISTLPFRGGWFVYLGYELANQIEPRLKLPLPASGPIALAIRIPAAIIIDHASGNAWIVAESANLIAQIENDVEAIRAPDLTSQRLLASVIEEDDSQRYLSAVSRALEYIREGDVYQANLSRGWRAQLNEGIRPHDIYRRLRKTNPGPFNALAVLPDLAIVSSSPERLVRVHEGWVSTRPIAGTRPRGEDAYADQELVHELHAHPKERAEHIMLIDLERNDLGRVCEAGTVEVDEYMTIETYAHVHHIVSNVRGKLRADVPPGDVLAAIFPGGTITGCPKVRCMEIIAELEGTCRGAYTGSLGYVNLDGSMDFNILIRSLEIRGSQVSLRAGAGIVADSIPERELEESRAKARGVLKALNEATA